MQDKEWTIMIYMAGDNNLSADMAYALEQIKSVTSQTDKINIFVYFDGYSSNVPTLYCDFSEQNVINYYRSFMIEDKLIKRDAAGDINENSANVDSIINFVDWCVNKVEHNIDGKTVKGRRAKKYAMIFSGHSFGFQNQGLFKDEKADYHMTLRKLRWMFKRITDNGAELKAIADVQQMEESENWSHEKYIERTTPILGQKLSILGFDSCVMSMLEIGCQFREIAETMVASEGSIPNAGWSYAQMLLGKIVSGDSAISGVEASENAIEIPKSGALVTGNGGKPPAKFAPTSRAIAASFVENFIIHQNKFSLADISVDLSAWDLTKVGALEHAVHDLVEGLLECFSDEESIVYKQLKRILMQTHWECQTYMFDQNIDLGDFCKLLAAEIESVAGEFKSLDRETYEREIIPLYNIGGLCRNVRERILDCVIVSGFSGGEYQFSSGISMFFPWSWSSYCVSQANYERLSFVEMNKTGELWNRFLQRYLGEINRRRAKGLSRIGADGVYIKDEDHSVVYKSYFYSDKIVEENEANNVVNEYTRKKMTINGSDRILDEQAANNFSPAGSKIPINGSNKIPINGSNKIPINGSNKIPINGTNKIPINGTNKIPINGSNRLLGASSVLFSDFMITKNIESFWNHSGFTSKTARFMDEKKSAGKKNGVPETLVDLQDVQELPLLSADVKASKNLTAPIIGIPGGNRVSVNPNDSLGLSSVLADDSRFTETGSDIFGETFLQTRGIKNRPNFDAEKFVNDIDDDDFRDEIEIFLIGSESLLQK